MRSEWPDTFTDANCLPLLTVSDRGIDSFGDFFPKRFLLISQFLPDNTCIHYLSLLFKQTKKKKKEKILWLVSMHEQEVLIYLLSCLPSSNDGYLTRLFIIH